MAQTLLIVDDDPAPRRLLEILVNRLGYAAETAADGDAALARLAAPLEPAIDLVLLDLDMPGLDGMAVLGCMRAGGPAPPVIVMTANGSMEAAAAAMRAGAVDFIVKPDGAARLKAAIGNALRLAALEAEIRRLGGAAPEPLSFTGRAARRIAATQAPQDQPGGFAGGAAAPQAMPLLDGRGDMRRLEEIEAEAIRFALVHYRGRMSAMARKLGIGRSTLYRKMKHYGLAGEAAPAPAPEIVAAAPPQHAAA